MSIPLSYSRRRIALYVIPIIIGLGGVLLSRELSSLTLRTLLIMLSVSVPLFVFGNLLARFPASRLEHLLLLTGVLLLIVGAALSLPGFSAAREYQSMLPPELSLFSRLIGIFSLLLGLFVVLYTVIRRGEDIEQLGERFRHLAEHINEGFILSSAKGAVFMVNDQFLDMFNLRREDILGENATELAERLNADPVREHIDYRAKGIASEYELTYTVRGEERYFWFNGKPIHDRRGRHTATLATVRDITEHHRLSRKVEQYARELEDLVARRTAELAQSEQRFRQLLISMNEGFLTIDGHFLIRFANARIGGMLGMSANALIGRNFFDLIDEAGRMRLLNLLARGDDRRHIELREELNFRGSGGAMVPALAAVAYIGGPDATDAVYSLVITNLAEQKELQHQIEERARELELANEELRAHDRAKDSFLSNVSHELRTPLSTIQGYVEMLESGSFGELSDETRDALRVMARNVHRLVSMINEMIEFSRMEIRGVQLHPILFSPKELAREALASFYPHGMAKNLEMNIEVPDQSRYAWGDPEKLGQVLGILLNNSVKFTESGGVITLRLEYRPENTLSISICDTGIGIDPVHQDRIFNKFYQVDRSKTRRYEGTGIGLSIAKSVITAHQGQIDLESEIGKGSNFTIILPHVILETPEQLPAALDKGSLNLLLIDATDHLNHALAPVLQRSGFDLRHAPNIYEAIRLLDEAPPDIILLNDTHDNSAGIDGISLILQHSLEGDAPLIVLTSETPGEPQEARNRANGLFFLQKPFTLRQLFDKLYQAHDESGEYADLSMPDRPASKSE